MQAEAVEGLSENFDTKEGQKDICRIAAARDRAADDRTNENMQSRM